MKTDLSRRKISYLARYALNITGSCMVFLIEISRL